MHVISQHFAQTEAVPVPTMSCVRLMQKMMLMELLPGGDLKDYVDSVNKK